MSQTTPQAIHLCHELLGWLIPLLDKFPRSGRFSLGDRLESALLDVLERLVEAAYTRANLKGQALSSANLRLEVARQLWRLCFEFKLISTKRYRYGAELMDDLGRQIGGWLRSSSAGRAR